MVRNKEQAAAYMRAYYAKNKEKLKEQKKQRDAIKNITKPKKTKLEPEQVKQKKRDRAKEWKALNPEKAKKTTVEWRSRNKEKVSEYNKTSDSRSTERIKAKQRKQVDSLTDSYVSHKIGMKVSECPAHLIEMKRESMAIKRLSRQIKQTTKAQNETSTDIS